MTSRVSDEEFVAHAMNVDDAYRIEKLLARGPGGVTELVSLDGAGVYVRKKMPAKLARRGVWSVLPECACPRLPRLLATYETPDWYVVVYEYVPGSTLEDVVERDGCFDATGAVRMIRDACEAVSALHAKGVVHRDLSPKNILIAADGVHVIDLGIARNIGTPSSRETATLGTHGFAAPEQYGFAEVDARSDVYSLGCLLGYAVTGLAPSESGSAEALADEGRVPASLASIVRRACSFEPSARYQSVDQLTSDLSVFLGEVPHAPAGRGHCATASRAFSRQGTIGGVSRDVFSHLRSRSHSVPFPAAHGGGVSTGGTSSEGGRAASMKKARDERGASDSKPDRPSRKRDAGSGDWKSTLARVVGLIAVLLFLFACFFLLLLYLSSRP